MYNQLKVSFYKLRHFWLLPIAIICMSALGFSYGYIKLASVGYRIYDAFQSTCCDTSFMFLLTLVSAWFIGSDFNNRTIHHEITLGYSRWSVIAVRELPIYLSAAALHFTYIISTMLGVGSVTGFSDGATFHGQDLFWCATVLLQLIALQSIIAFIAFLCAKAPAAIAVSVCFTFITCNLLRNYFHGKLFTRSCFCLARDNAQETLVPTAIAAVCTAIAATLLTYFIFRKKEIK